MSELGDEYSESLEREFRKLEEALLSNAVKLLAPSEPIRLRAEATAKEAVAKMVDTRRGAGVSVDAEGHLAGVCSERDALTRVVRQRRNPEQTKLVGVMTPEPETLAPEDRICYAVNRMHVAGHRSIPLVDADHRPLGIVTVNDVVKWLAEIFPEAVLNLRPGDKLKRPHDVDSG